MRFRADGRLPGAKAEEASNFKLCLAQEVRVESSKPSRIFTPKLNRLATSPAKPPLVAFAGCEEVAPELLITG